MTDLPTPVNLVNHAYFNLAGHAAGSQQLYNHRLQLYANQYTPVNSEKIPTGELASVNGTAFDLRSETRLGDVINLISGGYDHNFVASISTFKFYKTLPLVANLWHPESGRFMQIFSNQPGFQLYTGNVLPTDDSLEGKNGTSYKMHDGLCIETQNFPNAINQVFSNNNFESLKSTVSILEGSIFNICSPISQIPFSDQERFIIVPPFLNLA